MKYGNIKICVLLASCIFLNACATYMTMSSPPLKEVVLEEKTTAGRQVSTNYLMIEGPKDCTLMKRPYCMGTSKERIIFKKRLKGITPALFEIGLLGFGLVDLVIAKQHANNSVREEEGQIVETGSIIECGEVQPAGNTELVVQCAETGEISNVKTDQSGEISVDKLFAGFLQNSQLNVFVRDGSCFAYITTFDRRFN